MTALDHLEDPTRPAHLLTYDAEAAGDLPDSPRLRAALSALLHHPSAPVREGAVYGFAKLLQGSDLAAVLAGVLDDASPGVRAAAEDGTAPEAEAAGAPVGPASDGAGTPSASWRMSCEDPTP